MSEHMSPIPSMIYNAAVGGHVTNSQQIIDEDYNLEQKDINKETLGVPYNATTPNGMGKIVLKKNDNFKQVVEAQTDGNTIFVIKYDYTLTGNVTIPANCVLKFDGGSVRGASIQSSGIVTVKGYGLLCPFVSDYRSTFFIFENPYCVDTTINAVEEPNGSPEKPFYYLNDALRYTNNIVIRRNSIISVDQAKGSDSFVTLPHPCKISTYGIGNKPVFSGLCKIDNFTIGEKVGNIQTINFNNAKLVCLKNENIQVTFVNNNEAFNFGAICDGSLFASGFGLHKSSDSELDNWQWKQTTHRQYGEIKRRNPYNNSFTAKYVISGLVGISCGNYYSLNIDNCRFEGLKFGISSLGSNSIIKDCEFNLIGGNVQNTDTFTLLGNGVEGYATENNPLKNITFCNNSVSNCYDAGFTLQASSPGNIGGIDFICENNVFSNTKYGVEFFNSTQETKLRGIVRNNRFICCDSRGSKWTYEQMYGDSQIGGAIRVGHSVDNYIIFSANFVAHCCLAQINSSGRPCFLDNNVIIANIGDFIIQLPSSAANSIKLSYENLETVNSLLNSYENSYNNVVFAGLLTGVKQSGDKSHRPTGGSIYVGFQYMQIDGTYGTFPIWASAISGDTVTWVDATGTPV